MQKIVILNPKGGSGKTTIATNLASYFAANNYCPALLDFDSQGSSTRWLQYRPDDAPPIHGISSYEQPSGATRSWHLRVPPGTDRTIVDTPAAIPRHRIPEYTRGADVILVPVLPSQIDIHAASRCIADLLLVAKISRREDRIAIVANRVKKNTRVLKSLMRFLESLEIPFIASLRDTQNYIRAAEHGLGIHDMPRYRVRDDLEQWEPLIEWIKARPTSMLRNVG